MNAIIKSAAAGLLLIGSGAAFAEADLIATASSSKAGGAVGIDMLSAGEVVNFQTRIQVADSGDVKVDTSRCLATLPQTHKGTCVFNKDGSLFILAYSLSNTPLPKGHLALGEVRVSKVASDVKVTEFLAADVSNKAVSVSSRVGSDSTK
ncbi:MAG: hypothetical protein KDI56_08975 [Xanthomonadales bacterium]|nr:hypothetical protein [Xanthomonadales bacterium]